MNIDHLKLFVRLATTSNISQAGQELGISPAVASTHINKLEQQLGVRLVHRTTRKVSLTEEGRTFLPHAEEILGSVDAAKAAIGVGNSSPKGTLRITAPASFGCMHLMPALTEFMSIYPDLAVDLRLTDTIVDLVEGGFDIAIRNAGLKDSSLIARKLAPDRRILTASPDYLSRYGEPETLADLTDHRCITLIGLDSWSFHTPSGVEVIKVHSHLRTDHGLAMRDACVNGMGIAMNASWSVYEYLLDGSLVEILPDYPEASNAALWAVFPSSRLIPPKVRVFIDYFSARYGEVPYWDSALNAGR